ncbi:MAG: nickel-responsive transcriptional regulator NikR [Candidatus Aminicenantales bacterium]
MKKSAQSSPLIRFGISIPPDLIEKFDAHIRQKSYSNRSEAIRDLIRNELAHERWSSNEMIVGVVTIVYNHHSRNLVNKILDIQHDSHAIIISTQHIHLDPSHCLEIIVVKGKAADAQRLADSLQAVKGVQHATIIKSSSL